MKYYVIFPKYIDKRAIRYYNHINKDRGAALISNDRYSQGSEIVKGSVAEASGASLLRFAGV